MLKRSLTSLIVLSFMLIISGCGSGGTDAPATAIITISPETDVEVTDGSATVSTSTKNFHITITNDQGIPLEDVNLHISYIWAVPNSFGPVQLYDGTTAKNSPMLVKTDINGTYNLRLDFQSGGGLAYSGNLQVTSGAIFGSRGFAVAAGSS